MIEAFIFIAFKHLSVAIRGFRLRNFLVVFVYTLVSRFYNFGMGCIRLGALILQLATLVLFIVGGFFNANGIPLDSIYTAAWVLVGVSALYVAGLVWYFGFSK